MKKWLKRLFLVLFTIVALYGIGRLSVVTYDSYVFVPRQPYLQMQTTHSIELKWQTPEKERGCVHYSNQDIIKKVCEPIETDTHHIVLKELQPGTKYKYSVDATSLDIDNDGRYFTTLYDNEVPVQRIWVIGDSGKSGPDQFKVRDEMLHHLGNNPIDLWLLLGDNAYRSGTQKQYNKNLFKPYKEQVKTLVPWAINGNHDGRRWAFYDIFDFPTQGESGGVASGSEKYYAIDNGNVHILMLDSFQGDLSKDGAMAQWLEKDLAQNKKQWTIAAFHHPAYSHGSHNSDNPKDSGGHFFKKGRLFQMRENILPILEKYDVDLMLAGHSHGYERSKLIHKHYGTSDTFTPHEHIVDDADHHYHKPHEKHAYGGAIHNVAGSAAKVDSAAYDHPAMPFSYGEMGSVLLTITPKTLQAEFVTIDGEVRDFYSISKE